MLKFTFSTVAIGLQIFALTLLNVTASPIDSIKSIQCGPTDLEAHIDNLIFYLYTPFNKENGYILQIGNVNNLRASLFNSAWPSKYLIHGWTNSAGSPWVVKMRQNYLDVANYNIIAIDWSSISRLEYTIATRYTPSIGKIIAQMVLYLNTEGSQSNSNIHVIGHSLGGQIAGFVGAESSGNIARITGMDPASPCYDVPFPKDVKDVLDETDALFVDVIHTDRRVFGTNRISGHADFFPNGGGAPQPGCDTIDADSCSHGKSTEYMIESILTPHKYPAHQCASWNEYQNGDCASNSVAYMGDACDPSTRGIYYLTTATD